MIEKRYLGDNVYAQGLRSGVIILTAEHGLPTDPSNVIWATPKALEALQAYIKEMKEDSENG